MTGKEWDDIMHKKGQKKKSDFKEVLCFKRFYVIR